MAEFDLDIGVQQRAGSENTLDTLMFLDARQAAQVDSAVKYTVASRVREQSRDPGPQTQQGSVAVSCEWSL